MVQAQPPAQGSRVTVDTAALAVHLGCTPAYVRLLVSHGVIAPLGRWRRGLIGRPTMWFSLDAVDAAIERAEVDGRVSLDKGLKLVRK